MSLNIFSVMTLRWNLRGGGGRTGGGTGGGETAGGTGLNLRT